MSKEIATITTVKGTHKLTLDSKGMNTAWNLYMSGELEFDVYTEFVKLISNNIIGKTEKDKLK